MSKKGGVEFLVGLLALMAIIGEFLLQVFAVFIAVGTVVALFYLLHKFIVHSYYRSKKFLSLKEELSENTRKFNELNEHIKDLKNRYSFAPATDYGTASYSDNSIYNYKRPYLSEVGSNTTMVCYCSLSVCKNAQQQPFKYVCKYFNIPVDEDSLNVFESMFNDYLAVDDGRRILLQEREAIKEDHSRVIPFYIRRFGMKNFFEKLGYTPIDMTNTHFPHYTFKYVSAGGNSSMVCDIVLDFSNLERFISFLYSQIELKKTVKYQRSLMTKRLRTTIKERDNYTCQICGISQTQEPHLLLEVDHIIPVSKNGKTTIDNLQTLCWRCNRQKSNKMIR